MVCKAEGRLDAALRLAKRMQIERDIAASYVVVDGLKTVPPDRLEKFDALVRELGRVRMREAFAGG